MINRSPPSVSCSTRMRAMALSPETRVVLSHVSSSSPRVSGTTYFGRELISLANGSPARSGHAAAIVCHVRRANSSASALVIASAKSTADHLGIEERVRPAPMCEATGGVLVGSDWRLHHALQAHELINNDAHGTRSSSSFRGYSQVDHHRRMMHAGTTLADPQELTLGVRSSHVPGDPRAGRNCRCSAACLYAAPPSAPCCCCNSDAVVRLRRRPPP